MTKKEMVNEILNLIDGKAVDVETTNLMKATFNSTPTWGFKKCINFCNHFDNNPEKAMNMASKQELEAILTTLKEIIKEEEIEVKEVETGIVKEIGEYIREENTSTKEEEMEVEEPSEIVKWLVHNIRTTGEASALSQSEAEEAMAICTELKTKCEYNGQGRFIITVLKEEPITLFKLYYDVSYDSVEICENQTEIVTANSFDEARVTLIKRLELLQPGIEIFINGGYEMKELTNRIKRDTLEQRLSAIQRAMGMCDNLTTYKELASEYNKVQDQITQLLGVK